MLGVHITYYAVVLYRRTVEGSAFVCESCGPVSGGDSDSVSVASEPHVLGVALWIPPGGEGEPTLPFYNERCAHTIAVHCKLPPRVSYLRLLPQACVGFL